MKDILNVTTKMIAARLSDEQRYPSLRNTGKYECEISIEGSPDLSASLRDIPYDQAYARLLEAQAFNLKLVDGALVQMCYSFRKNVVVSHRLAFFPAPHLESYDDAPDLYEADEIFADIIAKYIVRFPIRFDFSSSDSEYVDILHPRSHVTLGQYKNCRIPVTGPLSPGKFMRFIVRNFYFAALKDGDVTFLPDSFIQPETISDLERRISHVVV